MERISLLEKKCLRLGGYRGLSAIVIIAAVTTLSEGQSPNGPSKMSDPSTDAENRLAFDVASIRLNKSNDRPNSNFPLGPGNVYIPNGGFFSVSNVPLVTYIFFAYGIKGNQEQYLLPQLPEWAKTDHFDIRARAQSDPGKDGMRMMMRSLLADRFKLSIHNETREIPVLAIVLVKPGEFGPDLRQHLEDPPCPTTNAPQPGQTSLQTLQSQTVTGGFPAPCGGIIGMPPSVPGRMKAGARNVSLGFIADSLSAVADLGRPMVDQTGLTGSLDFLLEWTRETRGPALPGAEVQPDSAGTTFQEALREQLGLKLVSRKAPVDVLVLDHVEHPSEN